MESGQQMIVQTDDDAMSYQSALSDSFMNETLDEDDHSSSLYSPPAHHVSSSSFEPNNNISRPNINSNITRSRNNHIAQHLTFNQDRSCIAMALDTGYRIHTLPNAHTVLIEKTPPSDYWKRTNIHQVSLSSGSVHLISMLHETSLLVIIQKDTPRILSLIHAKHGSILHQLTFPCAIIRVEMNRSTLVVLTNEGRLHCFSFFVSADHSNSSSTQNSLSQNRLDDIHLIHRHSFNILAPNENARLLLYAPNALNQGAFFHLSSHCFHGHSWLVTKCQSSIGSISLYDTSIPTSLDVEESVQYPPVGWILTQKAHDHSITNIAVGTSIFATASQKGTMIRVFRIPDGDLLYQMSRGTTPCPILSLILNPHDTVVAVCSLHNTIHIFHLYRQDRDQSTFRDIVLNRLSPWKKVDSKESVPSLPEHGIQRSLARIHLNRVIGTTQHIMTLLDVDSSSNSVSPDTSYPTMLMLCTEKGDLLQYELGWDGTVRLIHTYNVLLS